MRLRKKLSDWAEQHLITPEQRQNILKSEQEKFKPFLKGGFFWIGLFFLMTGITSIIADYWSKIPDFFKLSGAVFVTIGCIVAAILFFKKERYILTEVLLFLGFLGIGALVGLTAQIFSFPLDTGKGLLIWALISFIIVLFTRKIYLPLLWIPLFLGGILGYLKWEFLFLFFQQVPVLTTVLTALLLLFFIYITSDFKSIIISGFRHWAIILYFCVVFLGDFSIKPPFLGLLLNISFLSALNTLAVLKNKKMLFNFTSFLLIIRLIIFYFQSFSGLSFWGTGFLIIGLILLFLNRLLFKKTPNTDQV